MIMYFSEFAVNANVFYILDFLDRENRFIQPHFYRSETSDGLDMTVNYHSQCIDNVLSICTKIFTTKSGEIFPRCYEDAPDGEGNEVIKFEVSRLTDSRSLIKGSYAEGNTSIELMYLIKLKRLLMAFESKLPEDLEIRLEELQEEEGQWGWQEAKNTILGNKVQFYGKLPKQSENDLSTQPASKTNSKSISINKNMTNSNAIIGDYNSVNIYSDKSKKKSNRKKKK